MIYKRGKALAPNVVRQIGEIVQMSINLWGRGNEPGLLCELVGAVLKDEPYKVQRIANTFNVRMADFHEMWVVSAGSNKDADQLMQIAPRVISDEISYVYSMMVFDAYEGDMVVLTGSLHKGLDPADMPENLCAALEENGVLATVTVCRNLIGLTQLRKAYLLNKSALNTAREIYPAQKCFSYSEIKFADRCRKIVESGETVINQHVEILSLIPKTERVSYQDMLDTLTAYYLDARCNIALAGKLLYLHKNTIQYRLRKFKAYAPDNLEKIIEVNELYTALAVGRLLGQSKSG
jgi:sugar diacid utilization regulator